jgi:lycopene cyclase domain-containing protein
MFGHFSHIAYACFFIAIPVFFLISLHRKEIYQKRKIIYWLLLFLLTWGVVSDNIAVMMGIWGYNPEKLLNIWIFYMPIDNLFFGSCIIFALAGGTIVCSRFEEGGNNIIRIFKSFLGLK